MAPTGLQSDSCNFFLFVYAGTNPPDRSPFNMRNEIDRHNSTVGGHGSNTHFVTGDGGFINAFVSGFGGLMLGATQQQLRLSKPTVPERTGGLRFRGLKYLGGSLDYELTATSLAFSVHETISAGSKGGAAKGLCLTERTGAVHPIKGNRTAFETDSLEFPAGLGECAE